MIDRGARLGINSYLASVGRVRMSFPLYLKRFSALTNIKYNLVDFCRSFDNNIYSDIIKVVLSCVSRGFYGYFVALYKRVHAPWFAQVIPEDQLELLCRQACMYQAEQRRRKHPNTVFPRWSNRATSSLKRVYYVNLFTLGMRRRTMSLAGVFVMGNVCDALVLPLLSSLFRACTNVFTF